VKTKEMKGRIIGMMVIGSALFTLALPALAEPTIDENAAQSLMKKSGCFKCHSVDKKKDGPPYKEVVAKYKGKPDTGQKLETEFRYARPC